MQDLRGAISKTATGGVINALDSGGFGGLDIANNCTYGIRLAPDAGHHGRATIDGTTVTGSNIALSVGAGAEAGFPGGLGSLSLTWRRDARWVPKTLQGWTGSTWPTDRLIR